MLLHSAPNNDGNTATAAELTQPRGKGEREHQQSQEDGLCQQIPKPFAIKEAAETAFRTNSRIPIFFREKKKKKKKIFYRNFAT